MNGVGQRKDIHVFWMVRIACQSLFANQEIGYRDTADKVCGERFRFSILEDVGKWASIFIKLTV